MSQGPGIPSLPVKTQVKKALSTLVFSMSSVTTSPTLISTAGPHSPLSVFAAEISAGAFLVALHIPHQIQIQEPRSCTLRQFLYV